MSRRHALALLLLAVATAAQAAPGDEKDRARTLEAITIEGEVQAPPVQFITARDSQRFADDAGRRYRPGALAVLAGLRAPVRLRVAAPPGCPPFEPIPMR